jgi:hypothetical protein
MILQAPTLDRPKPGTSNGNTRIDTRITSACALVFVKMPPDLPGRASAKRRNQADAIPSAALSTVSRIASKNPADSDREI